MQETLKKITNYLMRLLKKYENMQIYGKANLEGTLAFYCGICLLHKNREKYLLVFFAI
jgi:hypothetical protein